MEGGRDIHEVERVRLSHRLNVVQRQPRHHHVLEDGLHFAAAPLDFAPQTVGVVLVVGEQVDAGKVLVERDAEALGLIARRRKAFRTGFRQPQQPARHLAAAEALGNAGMGGEVVHVQSPGETRANVQQGLFQVFGAGGVRCRVRVFRAGHLAGDLIERVFKGLRARCRWRKEQRSEEWRDGPATTLGDGDDVRNPH